MQVAFVSINTVFLARVNYIGVVFSAFMISFIWTSNVRKAAFGSKLDRIAYSVGATAGSLAGLFVSQFFVKHIELQ